jgi:phage baseplate assembly protein W
MSTLEKNIYKRVKVSSSKKPKQPASSSAYRSISTVNPANEGYRLYDLAVIKQDIINHFHIRQGEKLENPEFGTIIWDTLFDPLTEGLKAAIIENVEDIVNYDPRVSVNNIIVDTYESGIQIECTLIYLKYSIAEAMTLQFDRDICLLA